MATNAIDKEYWGDNSPLYDSILFQLPTPIPPDGLEVLNMICGSDNEKTDIDGLYCVLEEKEINSWLEKIDRYLDIPILNFLTGPQGLNYDTKGWWSAFCDVKGHFCFLDTLEKSKVVWVFRPIYRSAVDETALKGDLEVVKWLYKHGERYTNSYLCDDIISSGNLEMLKYFVEKGCGWTFPGDRAANRGHLHIVKWLYEKGIKFTWRSRLNNDPNINAFLDSIGVVDRPEEIFIAPLD